MKLKFGILSLLAATTVVALFASQYDHFKPKSSGSISLNRTNGTAIATYGLREHKRDAELNQLDFVVFVISTDSAIGASISGMPSVGYETALLKSGRISIEIPSETQIHEIADGNYRTFDTRIDPKTFFNYIRSAISDHSAEGLIEYASRTKTAG